MSNISMPSKYEELSAEEIEYDGSGDKFTARDGIFLVAGVIIGVGAAMYFSHLAGQFNFGGQHVAMPNEVQIEERFGPRMGDEEFNVWLQNQEI